MRRQNHFIVINLAFALDTENHAAAAPFKAKDIGLAPQVIAKGGGDLLHILTRAA